MVLPAWVSNAFEGRNPLTAGSTRIGPDPDAWRPFGGSTYEIGKFGTAQAYQGAQDFFGLEQLQGLGHKDWQVAFQDHLYDVIMQDESVARHNISRQDMQVFVTGLREGKELTSISAPELDILQRLSQLRPREGQPFSGALGDFGNWMEDLGQSGIENIVEPTGQVVESIGEDGLSQVAPVIQEEVIDPATEFVEEEIIDPVAQAIKDFGDMMTDMFGNLFDVPDIPGIDGPGQRSAGRGSFMTGGMRVPTRNNRESGYLAARSGASAAEPADVRRRTLLGGQ